MAEIKEYIIKITADVNDAKSKIDSLAQSFTNINGKNGLDLDISKSTSQITGSIGKVIQQINKLQQSFDKINTDKLTSEISSLSSDLTKSINNMKDSFDGFQKTFEGLSGSGDSGFGKVFQDFSDQMKEMIDTYKSTIDTLNKLGDGSIIPQSKNNPVVDNIEAQTKQITDALNKQKEEISKAVEDVKNNLAKISEAQSGIFTDATGKTQYVPERELRQMEQYVSNMLTLTKKAKKIKGFDLNKEIFSQIGMSEEGLKDVQAHINESIQNEIDRNRSKKQITDQSKQDNGGASVKTTVPVAVNIQVVLDQDAVSESSIETMVNSIRDEIISKVNTKIKDHPIKIPIGIDAEMDDIKNSKKQIEDKSMKSSKEIAKLLTVKVNAVTDGMMDDINDQIKEINEKITQTIDVKVRPVLYEDKELEQVVLQTEKDINDRITQKYGDGGLPVDLNVSSNTFDEKAFGILTEINATVSSILGAITGGKTAGGTLNTQQVTPQNVNVPKISQPLSGSNNTIAVDKAKIEVKQQAQLKPVLESKPQVAKKPIEEKDTQEQPSTTPIQNKSRGFSLEKYARYITYRHLLKNERGGELTQNEIEYAKRYGESLLKEAAKALVSDIKSPKTTEASIVKRNYYNQKVGDTSKAFWGRPNQELSAFQDELITTFRDSKKLIKDASAEIETMFTAERSDAELVDSGINDQKVTKWMKRLIDRDLKDEKNESKGTRFKGLLETTKNFDHIRNNLIAKRMRELSTTQQEIDALKAERSRLMPEYRKQIKSEEAPVDSQLDSRITTITRLIDKIENDPVITKIKSMSNEELLKQKIKEEHQEKRKRLLEQTSGPTQQQEQDLEDIKKELISIEAKRISEDAVKNKFGKDILKKQKEYGISKIDPKDENIQKTIRKLESYGLEVDEKTGALISFKTPEISQKWGLDDLQERIEEIGVYGDRELEKQKAITTALAEGEEQYQKYIEAYEKHRNGTATDKDYGIIKALKDQIADRVIYFEHQEEIDKIIEENSNLERIMSKRNLNKDENKKYNTNLERLKEIQDIGTGDTSEFSIYEMTLKQMQRIEGSRETEKAIQRLYTGIINSMVGADSYRQLSKKTYEKNKVRMREIASQFADYDSRVPTIQGAMDRKGIFLQRYDTGIPDLKYLTEYESDERKDLYYEYQRIKRQNLGYEYAHNIRGFNGRLVDQPEVSVANMKVTNLGLSDKIASKYAEIPSIKDISTIYKDEYGRQIYGDQGETLYRPNGVTKDQLQIYSSTLSSVISEMGTTIASLPSTDEEVKRLAEQRYTKELTSMKEQLTSIDQQIKEQEEINAKIEAGEISGKVNPMMRLRGKRDKLEHSIEQLEGGSYSSEYRRDRKTGELVLTGGGEKLRQNKEELKTLEQEEKDVIARLQKEIGLTDNTISKIETLRQAKKDREEIRFERNNLGEQKIKKDPRDLVVKSVDAIIESIFGKGNFDFKPVTGYDFKSADEAASAFEDLDSLVKMYDDIIAEATKALRKVLPKDAAEHILQEFEVITRDQYGEKIAASTSGELVERLRQIREKREELTGEIKNIETEMARTGEKDQSLKDTRIKKYIGDINQRRENAIKLRDAAARDKGVIDGMINVSEIIAEQEKKEAESKAIISKKEQEIAETLSKSKEERVSEIKARTSSEIKDIMQEIFTQNKLLIDQWNGIVEEYVESTKNVKQKRKIFSSADQELSRLMDENKGIIKGLTKEKILEGDEGYRKIQEDIAQLESQISAAPSSERKKLREEKLIPLKGELTKKANSIAYDQLDIIDMAYDALFSAASNGEPADKIKNLAFELKKAINVGNILGTNFDIDEYGDINEIAPSKYIDNIVNQEVDAKQAVVDLARQELDIAEQRQGIARRALSVATTDKAEKEEISSEYTLATDKYLDKQSRYEAAEKKYTIAKSSYDSAKKIIDNGGTVKNFEKITASYQEAEKNFKTAKTIFEIVKKDYIRLGDLFRFFNGDDLVPEIDKAATQFITTQTAIGDLQRKQLLAIERTQKEIELSQNDSEYRDYLYERANIPKPIQFKGYDELAKARSAEEERKRREAQEKITQEQNEIRDAEIARWYFSVGGLERDKMEAKKSVKKEKIQAKKQKEPRQMFDWHFAGMSKDQAAVAKKIQRIVASRYQPEDQLKELQSLQVEAKNLGLTINAKGYVQPIVESKKVYQQNKSQYPIPEFSSQELIQYGILRVKDSSYQQYDETVEAARLNDLMQAAKGIDELEQESYNAAQAMQSMSDEIRENVHSGTQNYYQYALDKLNALDLGNFKSQAVSLWNSLKQSVIDQESADKIVTTISTQLETWKKESDTISKQTLQTSENADKYNDSMITFDGGLVRGENITSINDQIEQLKDNTKTIVEDTKSVKVETRQISENADKYNDSMITFESDIVNQSRKLLGSNERNNIPYTEEDFSAEENLAQRVINAGRLQASKGNKFWIDSIENAKKYIESLASSGTATTITTHDQSPISSGDLVTLYRGVGAKGTNGAKSLYHDEAGTFFTDNFEAALQYAEELGNDIYKLQISRSKLNEMLNVDALGSQYTDISLDGVIQTTDEIAEKTKADGQKLGVVFSNVRDGIESAITSVSIFSEELLDSAQKMSDTEILYQLEKIDQELAKQYRDEGGISDKTPVSQHQSVIQEQQQPQTSSETNIKQIQQEIDAREELNQVIDETQSKTTQQNIIPQNIGVDSITENVEHAKESIIDLRTELTNLFASEKGADVKSVSSLLGIDEATVQDMVTTYTKAGLLAKDELVQGLMDIYEGKPVRGESFIMGDSPVNTSAIETAISAEQELTKATQDATNAIEQQNAELNTTTPIKPVIESIDQAQDFGVSQMDAAAESAQNYSEKMQEVGQVAQDASEKASNVFGGGTTAAGGGGTPPNPPDDIIERYIALMNEINDSSNIDKYSKLSFKSKLMGKETIGTQDLQFLEEYKSKLLEAKALRDEIFNTKSQQDSVTADTLWSNFEKNAQDVTKPYVSMAEAIQKTKERFDQLNNTATGKNFKSQMGTLGDQLQLLHEQLANDDITLDQYTQGTNSAFDNFLGGKKNIEAMNTELERTGKAMDSVVRSGKDQLFPAQFQQLQSEVSSLDSALKQGLISVDLYKTGINDAFSNFDVGVKEARELENAMKSVQKTMEGFKQKGFDKLYPTDFQEAKQHIEEINDAYKNSGKTASQYYSEVSEATATLMQKYNMDRTAFGNKKYNTILDNTGEMKQLDVGNWVKDYVKQNYNKVIQGVTAQEMNVNGEDMSVFTAQVQDADGMVQKLKFSWSEVNNAIKMSSQEMGQGQTGFGALIDSISGKVKQLSVYWTAQLFNPYRMIGNIKQIANIAKEYDSAMMEIRKVSNESSDSMDQLKMSSFQMGDQVGSTGKDILKSVASWKRLGKSFEESQEAAVASNWLLNVSEFTNIDDATKSLVSMTQAFDDLSYESAIDKLNGVGDAFSSSTDQIASGMQNVASVLQVAGNDVDQSIALLAAANDVTQDMSKASMGVRTVALRIAGTQDAKQQLEDLGEDTSDFIVQTTSKVDEQVRKYTATAKTPNGISVLDESGRLRDTYSILLDIANVWDDIVAADDKFGTNRSNALLELLAGKTRSNVLASILQAPDVLESAYETSKNSAGVGQKELDIYLDSIEAKTIQLTNHLQELANITINADGFKALLDIINAILSGVNALAKGFGGLNSVIGMITGAMLQKNGLGMLATKGGKGWAGLFKGKLNNSDAKKILTTSVVKPLEGQAATLWNNLKLDPSGNFMEQMVAKGYSLDTIKNSEIFKPALNGLSDMQIEAKTANDVLTDLTTTIQVIPQKSKGLSNIGDSFKSIISGTLTSIAVSAAIGLAFKGFELFWKNVIKAEDTAIQKGEEAKSKIQDIQADLSKKQDFQDNSAERLAELHAGVDQKTGKNINLSNEEYEEYLSLANEVAEIYPGVVSSYDAQGNAILNLSSNVKDATASLQEFLDTDKIVAGMEIGENLDDTVKSSLIKIGKLKDKIAYATTERDEAELSSEQLIGGLTLDDLSEGISYKSHDQYEIITKALKEAGIKNYMTEGVNNALGAEGGGKLIIDWNNNDVLFDDKSAQDAIDKANQYLAAKGVVESGTIEQTAWKKQGEIAAYEAQIDGIWKQLVPSIVGSFQQNPQYNMLSDELKAGITASIAAIDPRTIEKPSDKTWEEYFESVYLDPLLQGIRKAKNLPEVEKAFTDMLDGSFGNDKTNADLKETVNNTLEQLFPGDELAELRKTIRIALSFTYEDAETGEEIWNVDDTRDTLFQKMGGSIEDLNGHKIYKNGKSNISFGQLRNLDQEQQSALNYALDNMSINPQTIDGWETLLSVINRAKEAMTQTDVPKDGTLIDLFNNEDYQNKAEGYEKSLSSLTSALETMRTDGKLSAEAMADLQEEFPNLTDFTEEAIGDLTSDKLGNWITDIQKMAKELDFSPKGMEELNTYLDNLIHSYGDLGISAEEARIAVVNSFVANAKNMPDVDRKTEEAYSAIEQIQQYAESQGEEVNWQIVWELAMEDRFSDPAADIEAEYADKKLKWEIEIANAEELKRIQKDLEVEDAKRNLTKAKQSKKQTAGKDLTERDYVEIGNSLANTTELKKDAEKIAQENYDVAYDAYIDASKKAAASEETISGFKKKGGIPTSALQAMQDAEADNLTKAHNLVKTSEKELYDAQAETTSSEEEQLQNRIDQYQAESKTLQNAYTELEDGANQIQNNLKKREKLGMDYTKGEYQELINNAAEQMDNIDLQIKAKEGELIRYKYDKDIGVDSNLYREAEAAITELEGKQIDLKQQTQEWQTMISTGIELNQTKRDLEDLQTDATNIQDAMSFRETRGLKATVKDYQKLMKNSAEQIKNIKTQNDLLRQQQAELITNNGVAAMQSSTYRDIQAQIESNNQSLRGLAQNQYDWGKQMAVGQIENIMGVMSAAQSAMSTGHLADTDTLKNLISMNRDYASALVTTTSGTYVDAQAMAKLAEDQGDLTIAMIDAQKAAEMMNYEANVDQMMSMAQQIDPTITSIQQLNQALAEHPDSPEWSKILDLSDANFNIQTTLDQLQAMKEQVLAMQSYLGQYQQAQSSWNFSDPMQQIRGGMEGAKKLYDQGWWGKDDFTSFAKLIATNEQIEKDTFVDNFMENYNKAQKYLTEDESGVEKWIDKMTEQGYVDEKGDFDIKSMNKFADDMGFNTEFSEYMLMAMKDAGYNVDISRIGDKYAESYKQIQGTEANAGMQMKTLLSEMEQTAKAGGDIRTSAEQAGAALQRMKDAGASDEAISDLVEQYNELGNLTGFHIDPQTLEVTTTVDKSELEETEEEINKPKDMVVQIKEEYDISDEDITETNNAIQRAFEGNKANLDQELKSSGLSDYSAEDLLKIDFEDGQYLPDTAEAESALENLAVKIGLVGSKSEVTNDVANALVATLLELNSISGETQTPVSEADQTRAERFDLQKKQSSSEEPLYNRVVSEASQLSDSSAHSFLATEQENLKSQEITYKIKTELEGGATMNDLAKLTDEEIMTTFHCDASEVDEVRSKIEEMANSDGVDFTVKINEDQLTDFGTTISDAVKNALTGVDSSEATTAIKEITTSYEELETAMSGEPLKIEIDTDGAVESLENLKEAMEELGITPNKGNAEGTENSTAPPTNYGNTNKNNTKTNYEQSSNTVSQETSGSVESTSVEGGEVHIPGVVDVNEADTSAIEGEEVEMDGTATFTADTSGLEAAEAEASTPIEKDVHLNVVNSRLEGDTPTSENTEQTVTTNEVKNTEENNTITTKIKTEADTTGADEAKAAVEKVPREWRTRLSADDGTSGPARTAAEAIRDIPLSWSSSITATTTGLEAVNSLKEAIDKIQDKEITIKATTVNVDGTTSSSSSKIETESTTAGGRIIKVNGTAHATGTAFLSSPAHAKGVNWAIESDETALVNELGTEGLVRDGRFYQIPGGAQYINLKRGDIIFNHKQVEELNKHGHVISGGGHGKAYANGTLQSIPAHKDSTATGNVLTRRGGGNTGGGGTGGGGGSYVAATNDNTNALNQNTTSTNNNTGSTTQAAKNVETNLDKFKKWADSLFDWIEVRMERLQHSIDMNTAQSELNTTYQKKNSEINAAMKTTRQMIGDQEIGADKYEKQAAKVARKAVSMGALSQGKVNELVKKIQKGDLSIAEYKARKKPQQSSSSKSSSSSSSNSQSEEETPELTFIEEYKEWWDKSEQMRLSILENKQALKDLAQTKLDNIIEQYDTIVGLSEQIQSKADAQKENYLTYGKDMRSKSVEKTVDTRVDQQKRITKARQEEEKAYQKELKSALKEFGENSNQYREALARLEEVRTSRIESQTAERQIQLDYQEERLQSIQDKWETLAGYAASVQSSSESLVNLLESQKVENVLTSPYEKEVKQQQAQAKAQRNYYKKEMEYYAEEMKRAEKLYGKDSNDYIDAKKNFEEMRKNHYDASQQIIEIEKNYQQKRLNVIKEKWDSFINLAEARQGTAKAKEGLYNAQGKRLNGTEIKDTYLDQRYQQDQITQYYKKQYNDLNAERSRMKKVYGVDSNEYREWQASLEAAAKGWRESETAAYDLQRSFLDLNAQVMNFDITKLQHGIERIANAVSLKEKRGTRVGEMNDPITDNDYTRQIDANQKQIRLQRKMAEYYRLQQTGLDENSKQYMEFEQKIYGCENAMDSLNMQNEELKESARNNRWKSFYELSDQIDVIVSDYSHLIGLMNEESFFDDNGNGYQLTMNGLSAIAMYGEQIEANRQKVALYQEGLKALNEELANNMISEQKFAEDQKKLLGGIQESVNAMKSEKEAIIGLAKTQMTNEANVLKKIIQNRKDALSAKKA